MVEPVEIVSPMAGTVVDVAVAGGQRVRAGGTVLRLEAMKMHHPVTAEVAGEVVDVAVAVGESVERGQLLVRLAPVVDADPEGGGGDATTSDATAPADGARADLAAVLDRRARLLDDARSDAVARRHERGHRTARENVADLFDDGSFVEYGGLAIAAQRSRRSVEELIDATPADGMISGFGTVNADRYGTDHVRVGVLAYDAAVLAGTQGALGHRKKDRLLRLAAEHRVPVVVFAEGGGGRPGDTDVVGASYLDAEAFHLFARLSGLVPTVAVVNGRCFAGNAALAGCADLLVATRDSTLGMAGPAMIEGGGLGRVRPEDVGPPEVQAAAGVIDVLVDDEAGAVAVARRYLGYFQGVDDDWEAGDPAALRDVIPEDRRLVYDVRRVTDALVDTGSVTELRPQFAPGMITALARIGGRPVGLLANDPAHLGGAIDADGADTAARLLQLCDAHGLPVVVLCDTPGFMVGPDAEREGGVRHFSRMFVVGANLSVPLVTVVTRKGYGLGAQAMMGGHLGVPVATLAWPTAELGPMGLEGAVRLGFRRQLDDIADPDERAEREQQMIDLAHAHAKALNVATYGELDDVIDPADTRDRILAALNVAGYAGPPGPVPPGTPRRRPQVDAW
jgi:acetyl-CoA carboxylase carboxyltransferase component